MAMVDEALEYAGRGWSVFPLREGDKIPASRNGFKDACADEEQIRAAWGVRPNMNIGIATGGVSRGLVVIDLDVDEDKGEDGVETLRLWEKEHGELPETVTAVTGSGGVHMFYMADTPITCSVNNDTGVDVRGDGGYVVAPPSLHPNGRTYEWENHPDDYPLARADRNVYAFIAANRDGGLNKLLIKPKYELPETIGKGGRNDELMRYACSLQAQGYGDVEIFMHLNTANKLKCHPPLKDGEVKKIVESVTKRYEKGRKSESVEVAVHEGGVTLMRNGRGAPLQTIDNCERVITQDKLLADRFRYNEMSYSKCVELPVPWDAGHGTRSVTDADYCALASYLERTYGLNSKQKAIDAVTNACMANRFNPVTEWLDSLEWDGEEYIGFILATFLGADQSMYTANVMRLVMLGAVARAYEPGCKFDYMPVLVGKQGIGKSMFVRSLCANGDWYCDNFNTIDGDAAAEKLRGMWLVEMAELLATKRAKDVEGIKAFITSQVDTIRPKYARETEQRPRCCVFFGTTNSSSFLTDSTGNRRFLPIECGVGTPSMSLFDKDAKHYIEQAWAQAVHIYKTERPALVLDEESASAAMAKQEMYLEDDPRVGIIQQYLDDRRDVWLSSTAKHPMSVRVCAQEIIDKALPDAQGRMQNRFMINEMHCIMRNKIDGWVRYNVNNTGKAKTDEYGIQRCYVPIESPESIRSGY